MGIVKLGVLDFSPVHPGMRAEDAIGATLQLAPTVESFGYSRYWLGEHHSSSVAHSCPELLIPAIVGLTDRMRVGPAGILLGLYSPFKVAKTFKLLHALYPDRVDLGIARGGVTDDIQPLVQPLVRHGIDQDAEFKMKVAELVSYLRGTSRITFNPDVRPPDIWMLGSQTTSMQMAACHGTAFSLAKFLGKEPIDEASVFSTYRDKFLPTHHLPEPTCNIAVAGVCAKTDDEAHALIPVNGPLKVTPTLIGSPQTCKRELELLYCRTGVSEFIFLDLCRDFAAKVESYRLLAEALL